MFRFPTSRSTWCTPSTAPRSGPTRTAGSRRRRASCDPAGGWSSCAARRSSRSAWISTARPNVCCARSATCAASSGATRRRSSSISATASGSTCCTRTASRSSASSSCTRPRVRRHTRTTRTSRPSGRASGRTKRSGSRASVADAPPAAPLLLASRSPQRRAILEQLGLPFEVVQPTYDEDAPPAGDAVALVRRHASAKARSVAAGAGDRPVLGVDTEVVLGGRIFGKPRDASEAEQMLEALSGRTHLVVSGLCLVTPGWEAVEHESTRVTFRALTPRDLGSYVAIGEWEGRAGAYAI